MASEYTHDVLPVDGDRLVTSVGYYLQKIDRLGLKLWRKSTPDETRRLAVDPNAGGGYVDTAGEGDRIEFRDAEGNVLRELSRPSDDTVLDYPYGLQVVTDPG